MFYEQLHSREKSWRIRGKRPGGAAGGAGVAAGACRRASRGVFVEGFAAGTPAAAPAEPPPPPGAPAAVGLVTRDNENANNPHDFNVLEDSMNAEVHLRSQFERQVVMETDERPEFVQPCRRE